MLTQDEAAGWSKQRLRANRHAFRTGEGRTISRLDDATYQRAAAHQRTEPFLIGRQSGRQWWWYRDCVYRDDAGLLAADVRAIVEGRSA